RREDVDRGGFGGRTHTEQPGDHRGEQERWDGSTERNQCLKPAHYPSQDFFLSWTKNDLLLLGSSLWPPQVCGQPPKTAAFHAKAALLGQSVAATASRAARGNPRPPG